MLYTSTCTPSHVEFRLLFTEHGLQELIDVSKVIFQDPNTSHGMINTNWANPGVDILIRFCLDVI